MPTPASVKCPAQTQGQYININSDGITPACADNTVVKYNLYNFLYVAVTYGKFRRIFQ